MKLVAPDYFGEFACIKGDCRHTCCAGWEIDIDPESRVFFGSVGGEIGARLRENIVDGPDGAHFRLGAEERCPFLNENGLCDMIIELGEDSLCQICRDHPRFRNFFSDRTEIGLGLCCEAVGRLILERKEPFSLCVMEDDGEECDPDEDEEYLLDLRDEMISLAQDRSIPVDERMASVPECAGAEVPGDTLDTWADFLRGLEMLDHGWADMLECLKGGTALPGQEFDGAYEQLMAYLLYRHMPGALDDGDVEGRAVFAWLMWRIIRAIHGKMGGGMEGLVEICRMYSSEIEYSDENIAAILDEIQKQVA